MYIWEFMLLLITSNKAHFHFPVMLLLATLVEGIPKPHFSLHRGVGEGATPFSGILHFTLDPYLIMLGVKQGGIRYHFLYLWYDSSWDSTPVSQIIGKHSTH